MAETRLGSRRSLSRPFLSLDRALERTQVYLDGGFDREWGTETSGMVTLDKLAIDSSNVQEGIWYEPMSAKVLRRMMGRLDIDFGRFQFVDFGSGKGRVLMLAADFGFKKVIGVEFAPELHARAEKNIEIWQRRRQKLGDVELWCTDATEPPIPGDPLVAFFYSPFTGKVMEKVLQNLSSSWRNDPRPMVLMFYGENTYTIELLRATGFQAEELRLRPDWSRFRHYRGFFFRSTTAEVDPVGTEPP